MYGRKTLLEVDHGGSNSGKAYYACGIVFSANVGAGQSASAAPIKDVHPAGNQRRRLPQGEHE
jgi:hypothetical protein